MIVSVAAVVSIDGKLTRGEETDIHDWASKEDQQHFRALLTQHQAIVMGRGTYEVIKDTLKINPKQLRIVLTTHPDRFSAQTIPSQLEFCDQSPNALISSLKAKNIDNLLIVGGGKMITDWLAAKLVDRFYLTIEPYIFGNGKPLITDLPLDIKLELKSQQNLNDHGTILLTYLVL